MSLFTINSTEEDFADLQVESSGYRPQGPNNPQRQITATDAAMADRDNVAKSLAQSASEYAAMSEEDRAVENDYKRAQTMAIQAKLPDSAKRMLRRSQNKAVRRGLDGKVKDEPSDPLRERRLTGPALSEAQQARNAEFQAKDKARTAARNTRLKEAVQPMVAKRDAENAARVSEAKRMQNPQARLDSMVSRQGLMGGRLNFAEVKQGDGRSAMYVAPTAAGSQAYVNAKVNPRMGQQTAALGERAMGVTPQMPSTPSPAMPQGVAAAPAPPQSMVGMPTFDPSKLVVGSPAPARPQPPADPNAAAAIASFNQSAAQQPRGSSPAQNANLQNLQRGNIPTLASVPGMLASKAVSDAGSFVKEAITPRPNRLTGALSAIGSVAKGKTPLVGGSKPTTPSPIYQTTTPGGSPMTTSVEPVVAPRRVVQAANRDKKNPLMVN